jgi:tripartite-type tricarboxylate transporter receptor subunit TctC
MALIGCIIVVAPASAFPDKQVTLVVPFAAGGPADLIGRVLADALSKKFGQRVIVENITGAGGTIGSLRVANSAPDGHTMLLGHIGTHGAAPALYRKLAYDPVADFTPVGMVASTPMVLLANKSVGQDSLNSFRQLIASRGDKLTFSHGGVGSISHLGCVMLNKELGITATGVGYRGNGPALQDLLSGQVDYMCDAVSTAKPHIEAGNLRAVMMLSNPEGIDLPAPTAKSAGTSLDIVAWYALFLPKNVDAKVRSEVEAALDFALDSPEVKTTLAKVGTTTWPKETRRPTWVTPFLQSEIQKLKQVVEPID